MPFTVCMQPACRRSYKLIDSMPAIESLHPPEQLLEHGVVEPACGRQAEVLQQELTGQHKGHLHYVSASH